MTQTLIFNPRSLDVFRKMSLFVNGLTFYLTEFSLSSRRDLATTESENSGTCRKLDFKAVEMRHVTIFHLFEKVTGGIAFTKCSWSDNH
jgi:hypothetical protein